MSSTSKATAHGSRFDPYQWRGNVCRFRGREYKPDPDYPNAPWYWEHSDRIPEGDSASYGDLEPVRGKYDLPEPGEPAYFVSDFLSGSDYSGGTVERANYRVFLEDFGDRDGVHEVYGDFGTFAIAVRVDSIDAEMAETFDALEDYPVLSEDALGEIELEAQTEAWDCWARGDFVDALEDRLAGDADYPELAYVPNPEPANQGRLFATGERPYPTDLEDALLALFLTASATANVYWETETGGNAHIDVARVADAVDVDMLSAHGLRMEDGSDG